MSALCQVVDRALPAATGDVAGLPVALRTHVESCLRCQVEVTRYRKLARHLAALADVLVPAPPALVPAVMELIGASDPAMGDDIGSRVGRAAAAAGALVAAAGTVAVVRWLRTHSAA